MADIKAILKDPDFQKLSPAGQRQFLAEVDPDFSRLSDSQLSDFMSTGSKESKGVVSQVGTSVANNAKGLWDTLKTIPGSPMQLTALATEGPSNYLQGQVQQAKGMLQSHVNAWQRAHEEAKNGDYLKAIDHALLGSVPLIGPQAIEISDKLNDPDRRYEGLTDLAILLGGERVIKGAGKVSGLIDQGTELGTNMAKAKAWASNSQAAPQVNLPATNAPSTLGESFVQGVAGHTERKLLGKAKQNATQALVPGAGEPFQRDLEVALPLIAQEKNLQPLPSTMRWMPKDREIGAMPNKFGVVGKNWFSDIFNRVPDINKLNDVMGATQDALKRKGDQWQYLLDQAQQAGYRVQASRIRNAVLSSFPAEMQRRFAPTMSRIEAELYRLYPDGESFSPVDLDRKRTELTAQLRNIMDRSMSEQVAGERSVPTDVQLKAEKAAVNEPLYLFTGDAGRQVMREYGALLSASDALEYRVNPSVGEATASGAAPYFARSAMQAKMAEMRGAASNFTTGMARFLNPKDAPGQLMRRALRNVGVEPAPISPTRHLPGINSTTPLLGAPGPGPGVPQAPPGPGSGWTRPPGMPNITLAVTPTIESGMPQPQLGQPKIGPQRQLPAPPPTGGPPIPMPGQVSTAIPMPPVPDQSGIKVQPARPVIDPETGEVIRYSSEPQTPDKPYEAFAHGGMVKASLKLPSLPKLARGLADKTRLHSKYLTLAAANKTSPKFGVLPGTLSDIQQAQFNLESNQLDAMQAVAGGDVENGPTNVIAGENGPEIIKHSDGRPPDVVNKPTQLTLGTSGTDQVIPTQPFPKKGLIRGSANISLTDQGRHEARALGHYLTAAGGLDQIHASDLDRTQETAKLIAEPMGVQPQPPNPGFRSWAMGDLEGQPADNKTDETIQHHIHVIPSQPLPGMGIASTQPGESFNDFSTRSVNALKPLIRQYLANPRLKIGVVTHNRDEKTWKGWIKAGLDDNNPPHLDKRELLKTGDSPGEMHRITMNEHGNIDMQPYDPREKPLQGGVYTIRHLTTGWNAPRESPESGS